MAMGNKRGQKPGAQRRQSSELPLRACRFRRLVMPAELQRVHRAVLAGDAITEEMRAIAAKRWPELVTKLPPASE